MRIGLLVGGNSAERKVSLSSGKAIFKALEELGNSVVILDPKDGIHLLKDKIESVDLIFNGLHGGDGENGNVAEYLESLEVYLQAQIKTHQKFAWIKIHQKK